MELRGFLLTAVWHLTSALLELNVHPQTAKLGSDILIPCIFTANKIPVNPKFLAIFWYFQEKEILRYDNIVTRSHRRVSLNTDRAVYGIASLSLSNVRISDCGIYKCSVTYSPEKKEKEVTLDVHAPPTITITNNMVEKDIESILHSTITGFYPVKIDIEWLRDKEVLKSVNHSEPQQNSDGTYTVKSSVTLTPTEESKNHNYSIRVQHVSLYEPLQKKIQLVYDATSKTYVLYIVIAIIISIISIVIIALIIKRVRRRRNNDPKAPEVEEIKIPELIINTEAEFKCKCSNYFPNDLRVKWRQNKGGRYSDHVNLGKCRIPVIRPIEQPDGTFTCTAILGFTPSENSEEELDFECTVEHSALKNPITKTTGPLTILEGTGRTMTLNKNIHTQAESHLSVETAESKAGEVFNQKTEDSTPESYHCMETAEFKTGEASNQKTEDSAPESHPCLETAYSKTGETSNQINEDLTPESHLCVESADSETQETANQNSDDSLAEHNPCVENAEPEQL